MKAIRDYSISILLAVFFALFIRHFCIESYRIPSSVMEPTLLAGDIIFVSKWPIQLQSSWTPKKNEIVIFSETTFSKGTYSLDFIRRIIATPGDPLHQTLRTSTLEKVPPGFVVVMSDSHQKKEALVPIQSIKGKALCVWLSIGDNYHIRFERLFKKIL